MYGPCEMVFRREPHMRFQAMPVGGGLARFISWTGCLPRKSQVCHLGPGRMIIGVRFGYYGTRPDPVPLGGKYWVTGNRWKMAIQSVRKEGGDLIVKIEATNWAFTNWTFGLADWIFLREGRSAKILVPTDRCTPPAPNFLTDVGASEAPYGPGAVAPNQTVTGNLCFPLEGTAKKLFVQQPSQFPPPAFLSRTPIVPPSYPSPFTWFDLQR
jgi:hypothetical protein